MKQPCCWPLLDRKKRKGKKKKEESCCDDVISCFFFYCDKCLKSFQLCFSQLWLVLWRGPHPGAEGWLIWLVSSGWQRSAHMFLHVHRGWPVSRCSPPGERTLRRSSGAWGGWADHPLDAPGWGQVYLFSKGLKVVSKPAAVLDKRVYFVLFVPTEPSSSSFFQISSSWRGKIDPETLHSVFLFRKSSISQRYLYVFWGGGGSL